MIITSIRLSVMNNSLATASLATVCALTLAACSSPADSGTDAEPADITVSAAFYPLEFVADRVGGTHAFVQELTAPGVEPHDLELSPAAVREMQTADVVLYLSNFQPAVDDAVAATQVDAFDAGSIVELHAAEEHESEEEGADQEHGDSDPHFWLDPSLLSEYAAAVAEQFSAIDPDNASAYSANAQALQSDLDALDAAFNTALSQCGRDEIFVTHEAFGYLTERYGLHQEGLSGIDPESEPSPARLLEVRDLMAASGATTVFTETLVSPAVAESLASDAGVDTAVLDPLEGVTGNDDYLSVMNRNLDSLQGALNCA